MMWCAGWRMLVAIGAAIRQTDLGDALGLSTVHVRPLDGSETSVIRCARELVRRGHDVSAYTNCDAAIEHQGVRWIPLSSTPPEKCDAYIAAHQPELIGFVRKPRRRA